ncbi:Hpt domain-containing protein [Pseudodesulfovibrio pelocollis]|uniref:Hpt domain-containing protein n=1 Tax=Pseudodesulfovibrio pelocollis TaxID=3051432 RepID=UPI00255AF38F|nr:Hpt domain-containing protein [Pseudodesulfovibrio sp. SB368]
MTRPADEVLEVFLEETAERLDSIESGLLRLEKTAEPEPGLINSIFRDAHSVKAGANLLKLGTIEELAHRLENVLEQLRKEQIPVTEMIITASLEAVDKLRELAQDVDKSDTISIRLHTAMLEMSVKKSLEG